MHSLSDLVSTYGTAGAGGASATKAVPVLYALAKSAAGARPYARAERGVHSSGIRHGDATIIGLKHESAEASAIVDM